MKKYKVKIRVVEVRERTYSIYTGNKDDIHELVQATNFDMSDYDDEEFISNTIDEIKEIELVE